MKLLRERKESVTPDIIVYNPIDLFTKYKFNNSLFVNIGYIEEYELSSNKDSNTPMAKRVVNINAETDAELESYIGRLPNTEIKLRLIDWRNSDSYQNLLNGTATKKTVTLDLSGTHIIAVKRFTFQWRDESKFAKYYQDLTEKEWKLRHKYGFSDGFDMDNERSDEDYTPRWQDNYQGGNIMRRNRVFIKDGKPKTDLGNVYRQRIGVDNLYIDITDNKNHDVALRCVYNPRTKGTSSTIYYVDGNGNLIELTPGFYEFLKYTYKGSNSSKKEKEKCAEEKAFLKELYELEHTIDDQTFHEDTLLSSKILYVRGQVTPLIGSSKQSALWVNKAVVERTYDFVNPTELTQLITKLTRGLGDDKYHEKIDGYIENVNVNGESISDLLSTDADGRVTADPAQVRKRLGLTEHMLQIYESYKRKHSRKMNVLNESNQLIYSELMRKISKQVKRKLDLI